MHAYATYTTKERKKEEFACTLTQLIRLKHGKTSIGVTGHASRNRHELCEKIPYVHALATYLTKTQENVDRRDGSRVTQQTRIA